MKTISGVRICMSAMLALSGATAAGAAPGNTNAAGGPSDFSSADTHGVNKAQSDSEQLAEVIVTAQKRDENLQAVPVSVQVISGQILSNQNLNSLEALTESVPGVHVGSSGGTATSSDVFVRGIGSGNNPSFDQSVATFIDDVYYGRSRTTETSFLDLDRIEILKGPQSTFFGNNAIGGALNIVTKNPGDQFDAWGRALYGMYGQYATEGAIGGPIDDTFGARLAVTRTGQTGWIQNVNTGQHAPDENNEGARLTLQYKPSDDLDATLKAEGAKEHISGTGGDLPLQLVNCPPPRPYNAAFSGYGGAGCPQAMALGTPVGLNTDSTSGLPGQFSSFSTFKTLMTINYRKWGDTFTSVSGFYNYHFDEDSDPALTSTPVGYTQQHPESYHQFSQEFRVASPIGGPIEYLAGVYFQTDQLAWLESGNYAFLDAYTSIPAFAPLAPYLPINDSLGFSQNDRVYSGFGSLSWNVTDALKLTAALRESEEKKNGVVYTENGTGTQLYGGFAPLPPAILPIAAALTGTILGPQYLSRSDHALMPSARVQYQIDPEVMAYFSYTRGFKAGGINGYNAAGIVNAPLLYAPEYVNAYEIGLKSEWLDKKVRVNLDVFRSNYSNLQVASFIYDAVNNSGNPIIRNAADSVSQGVELETQWLVSKNLRLSVNASYLDAYYVNYVVGPPSTLQTFCIGNYSLPACSAYPNPTPVVADLSGIRLPYAPRWSGSVDANYSVPLAGYRFTADLITYFTTRYYANQGSGEPYGDAFDTVAGYVRLDGRLSLEFPDGRWAIDIIGKNLTNRIIEVDPNFWTAAKEEPFNAAIQVRYHW